MKSKTNANDVWSQYERLLDLEAEAIMNLSEEELDEEIRGSGLDPQQFGQRATRVFAEALGESGHQALAESRQTYQKEVTSLKRVRLSLPTTMKDKLELLKACLAHHHYLKPAVLTGQHRKLSDMAPSDVDSLLRQLHVLGLLKFKKT
ncbi:MAG: hypothetical protein OJF52_001829 [Nitrospira sp.]|jgi:hypothetical protein|nr:MAG: hypothetical protein OJF52_001829 [Nitrospira sp.]